MKTIGLKSLPLLGALLAVSCTYQADTSLDCIASVNIRLSYVDKTGADHLNDYLHRTDMYLFAADDTFIQKYSFTKAQSIDPEGIPIILPAGQYHMVTWGNAGIRTRITPEDPVAGTSATSFSLNHNDPTVFHPTTDTIFYNHTDFSIEDPRPQTIPIPLRRETCYIHIILSGYDPQREPYIRMTGLTNGYNFADEVQGTPANYEPVFTWNPQDGSYTADFAILRPKEEDHVKINLYDNTQALEVISLDLSVPLKAQAISLQKDIEPELTVRLDVLDRNRISVTVNDWHRVIDIHVEL